MSSEIIDTVNYNPSYRPHLKEKQMSKYERIGQEIGQLVFEKQIAYGDSFGNAGAMLKILYPLGIRVDQYNDALAVVRIIDKLFRIANEKDAFGENPYKDIAGYGILGTANKGKVEG